MRVLVSAATISGYWAWSVSLMWRSVLSVSEVWST